jgi:RNA polymerase sigma-70 factor, ECF subfamily
VSTAVPGAAASAEVVFRSEHGRIIASLIRLCGSFDRAEEAMQGFRCSAGHWPEHGVPTNPAAGITITAYRRLIDGQRRERTRREKRLCSSVRR